MPKTVAEKLQIKTGSELLFAGAPGQRALLDPMPDDVTIVDGIARDTPGVAVAFAESRAELDRLLADAFPHLLSFRAAWVVYRKGGRSDINRDTIWARVQEVGWTLTANVSVSDEWSSVRLKRAD